MPCTTILVGRDASYDGSCMIARNDDSGAGKFTPKKFVVIEPDKQARTYTTVISHLTIDLPDNPLSYTCVPNAVEGNGIWAATGVNELNVGMTATETITSNPRVLGADPLVVYDPKTGTPGGIGEEDLVYIVLPYINSAKEGVERLGSLLEKYGTYEMNGIAFSDAKEIWWLESIGGHHWMAKRVPDDRYVVMANQLGIDEFDFEDAMTSQTNYMCSKDLPEFINTYHLDLNQGASFNPRLAFGSHDDADHVYNTPRTWYVESVMNPTTYKWTGPDADFTPRSDNIPWSLVPENKITVEEVKYLLSSHYQGTPYDPYKTYGNTSEAGMFRSIGVNRTSFLSLVQTFEDQDAIQWIAFGANPFNVMIPFYTLVNTTPEYLNNTTAQVDTNNFYWASRLIGAMADASFKNSQIWIERYQSASEASSHHILDVYGAKIAAQKDEDKKLALRLEANELVAKTAFEQTQNALDKVLYECSMQMKDAYSRSDA